MTTRQAKVEAHYFLHQHAWMYAQALLQLRDDGIRAHDALECSACLMLAFAVEAHANLLLEAGFPTEYANERAFFSSGAFQGTIGKLEFLASRLQVTLNRGAVPFQTVCLLFGWRHRMVHPRIERIVSQQPYTDPSSVFPPESEVLAFPAASISRASQDCEAVCDLLQAAAHAQLIKGIHVPRAFKGVLSVGGVSL